MLVLGDNSFFFLSISLSDGLVSVTLPNVVTAEVSTPAGVPEETMLALTEGIAKGGYPVDIAAQSTLDLTSIDQSELGCTSALNETGLDPSTVAQLEEGYSVLGVQVSYSEDQDPPPSITEVIQPMEMAELADILPTLSLIEEVTPSGPPMPSVMEMLESFGLGMNENNTLFHLEDSTLTNGAKCPSPPCTNGNSSGVTELQKQDVSACPDTVSATGGVSWDVASEDKEAKQVTSKVAGVHLRKMVEWDKTYSSSS